MDSSVWRLILLICSVLVQYFSSATEVISFLEQCARYPKQINVDQLYDRSDGFASNDTLPFINSRDYIIRLAQGASRCGIKSAIIVVGPKSSGKSEGFKQIIPVWKESGHYVIVINLKGWESNVSSQSVMRQVANKFSNFFLSLDYQAQKCVFNRLLYSECVTVPWWLSIITVDSTWIHLLLSSPFIIYILHKITHLFSNVVREIFAAIGNVELWGKWTELALCITLPILLAYSINSYWYVILESVVHPIRENIATSNWYALTCSCNALSECVPEYRPIVIVQEVTNLNSESLNAFLRSLEQMKEGGLSYPVFVESSDFQWAYELPVIKSSDSFVSYRLQEMTREEGLTEVVHKFKLWTKEEYELIYDAIRGHLGSYGLLYEYNKVQKLSLNESIWHLQRWAYDHVLETVVRARNRTAVTEWLLSLKGSNYNMTVVEVPKDIRMLFKWNVLFRDSEYVYPQNRLLEHAIDKIFLDI